ncbi:MAG: hypothetical protein M1827_004797 [Pycnora praestabilis]|nr:MAG: hypothetical protein M1827_004797 [Pycnora praestabilis]
MLPSKIHPLPSTSASLTPEDILSSSLSTLYPDDTATQHGQPGAGVIYRSDRYGDLELRLADPRGEGERLLFAHYLWNAGVLMAELMAEAEQEAGREEWEGREDREDGGKEEGVDAGREMESGEEVDGGRERKRWSVRGEKVLELGAGSGLAGIVSALAGANEVVITDYPAPEILATITTNICKNIPSPSLPSQGTQLRCPNPPVQPRVEGHEWGILTTPFAHTGSSHFTRIIAADTLWMPSQHLPLLHSMAHFLSRDDTSARVFVIAGFHTGREKVRGFFEGVAEVGLVVERIWERDVEGRVRAWVGDRGEGEEGVTERKRWCVVAVLKRTR